MRLNGILAPICTPFAANGDLDLDALRRNIVRYNKTGLLGYVVAGSTGEAAFLGRDEKRSAFEAVRDAAASKLLIAGAGAESVVQTLAQIRDAADLGYHAALVLTPHYYRAQMARPESQIAFFQAVAEASPLPVLIYNFPQMTGVDLPWDVVAVLARHPNIVGIKESSADLEKVSSLTTNLTAPFQILVGSSAKFHDCLRLGAIGGVLAIANAAPRSALAIYDRYHVGDIAGSYAQQQHILDAAGVAPRYGIQGLKYAMDLTGYRGGHCRLPLLPLDAQQKSEIEKLFIPLAEPRP